MQGFMVYMSGGGVQIFSLMIVYQLVKNAITGMMGVNSGKFGQLKELGREQANASCNLNPFCVCLYSLRAPRTGVRSFISRRYQRHSQGTKLYYAKIRPLPGTMLVTGLRVVQMSYDGTLANTRVRLVSLLETTDRKLIRCCRTTGYLAEQYCHPSAHRDFKYITQRLVAALSR